MLREVSWIERNDIICFALFSAQAEWIVLGIRGEFRCGANLNLFGPLTDQVDDIPNKIWTNSEALENFLVFFQYIFA